MDALSQALSAVRMTGAIFFSAECTAPWGFKVPPLESAAHILAPGTERLVGYHLITEGEARVQLQHQSGVMLTPGDVAIFPHGDPHTVSHGSPPTLFDSREFVGQFMTGKLDTMRLGGGGEVTRFVCGYFGCERHADRLFLAGLPTMIRINLRGDAGGSWLESSIRHLVSETGSGRPGCQVLLAKMAEALFIETLRRYMEQLPPEHTGWLAGARDSIVGGVLVLLHRSPFHPWTLDAIAREVGTSRSVVAERFTRFLGEPPLRYLARWRLQLAARLLQTTHKSVLRVASDVGYESEAAFNRAFKREFGLPPAQYRRVAISSDADEHEGRAPQTGRSSQPSSRIQ